ncbi:ArsR family transcriptional regulator [Rhizobium sp. SJZ105]|nr:ArsR family transcriptional regulator [Rhizobium sp. SJZ105]
MATSNRIAEVAAAIGEPPRGAMLAALMDGRALTATELADVAAITPQTASGHLARLSTVGLIAVEKQGRHRCHRLANPEVAQMIESVMKIAGGATLARPPRRVGPKDTALREARTCYDHLAGALGVSIAGALHTSGAVEIAGDAAALTERGRAQMQHLGILCARYTKRSAHLSCVSGLERAPPPSGRRSGAAILAYALKEGWVRRHSGTRALEMTPAGRSGFRLAFGVEDPVG